MKSWLQLYCALSFLCLFTAASGIAASGDSESNKGARMAAPLAEMLFYEAAEQAVEDGYATIIPEEPEGKMPRDVADTNSKQAEQGSAPSEAESQNQKNESGSRFQ